MSSAYQDLWNDDPTKLLSHADRVFRTGSLWERKRLARFLAETGAERAHRALFKRLLSEPSCQRQEPLFAPLAELRPDLALEWCKERLEQPFPHGDRELKSHFQRLEGLYQSAEELREEILTVLLEQSSHWQSHHRKMALLSFGQIEPAVAHKLASEALLMESDVDVRCEAFGLLSKLWDEGFHDEESKELLLYFFEAHLHGGHEDWRLQAYRKAFALSDPQQRWELLVLESDPMIVKQELLQNVREEGGVEQTKLVERMLRDVIADVRRSALDSLSVMTTYGRRVALMERVLDSSPTVVQKAIFMLEELLGEEELLALFCGGTLDRQFTDGAFRVVEYVHVRSPERAEELMGRLLTVERAARGVVQWASRTDGVGSSELFRSWMGYGNEDIRAAGFEGLLRLAPESWEALAVEVLEHPTPQMQLLALETIRLRCLAEGPREGLLELLLQKATDEDHRIRRDVLPILSLYDDPRVFSELVSSVDDIHQDVQRMAQGLLSKSSQEVPVLRRHHNPSLGVPTWQWMRMRIAHVHHWAQMIGYELLGVPVKVHPYRTGLGRTWSRKRDEPVDIEISDVPITRGYVFGEQVMKGLVLHELGHHIFDIGQRGYRSTRGIARSEGLKPLYDILCDERLERGMRSRRPEWGVHFDRLASFAFAQGTQAVPVSELAAFLQLEEAEVLTAIEARELPGRLLPEAKAIAHVALRPGELLSIPGAIPADLAFLWCLRCGFDPRLHPDPRVQEAIERVPSDLKDIHHGQLLQVARQIGEILGAEDSCMGEGSRGREQLSQRLASAPALRRIFKKVWGRMDTTGQLPAEARQESNAGKVRECTLPEVQIVYDRPPMQLEKMSGGQTLNLGSDLGFARLEEFEALAVDAEGFKDLVAPIRPSIRKLRPYFERLGTRLADEYRSRRGRRLDIPQARKCAFKGQVNLLVHSRTEIAPDLYLGLLIDRSGSMAGDKLHRAKTFAALLVESTQGLRGIEGQIHAFDCHTLLHLGDLRRNGIAGLESGGGNNDAGALEYAASLALQSRKRNRLLVMISDGCPTQCSVASLRTLVQRLTRIHRIVCAQVAVEPLHEIAFPHYVDLSQYPLEEAVARFGRMLVQLTSAWR